MRISFHVGVRPRYSHNRNSRRGSSGGGRPIGVGRQIVFGFISIFLALAVIFLGYIEDSKANSYIKTTGIVVDHGVDYDRDSGERYSEIVEYEVDGATYTCHSNSSSSLAKSIGSKMEVRYDENNPNACIVGSNSRNVITYVIGGLFVVVGIVLICSGIKRKISKKSVD